MLGGADESLSDLAFHYGRHVGLAFQLVDDLLDFVSNSQKMGKPTAADLKLGLATAPVLYACKEVILYYNNDLDRLKIEYLILFFIVSVSRIEPNDYASFRKARRC